MPSDWQQPCIATTDDCFNERGKGNHRHFRREEESCKFTTAENMQSIVAESSNDQLNYWIECNPLQEGNK